MYPNIIWASLFFLLKGMVLIRETNCWWGKVQVSRVRFDINYYRQYLYLYSYRHFWCHFVEILKYHLASSGVTVYKCREKEFSKIKLLWMINLCHIQFTSKLRTSSTTYLRYKCPRQIYGCIKDSLNIYISTTINRYFDLYG